MKNYPVVQFYFFLSFSPEVPASPQDSDSIHSNTVWTMRGLVATIDTDRGTLLLCLNFSWLHREAYLQGCKKSMKPFRSHKASSDAVWLYARGKGHMLKSSVVKYGYWLKIGWSCVTGVQLNVCGTIEYVLGIYSNKPAIGETKQNQRECYWGRPLDKFRRF